MASLNNINLSNRLLALAALCGRGKRILDVGCDHGFLTIYLVQQGAFSEGICSDVNEGPLERAKEHIKENGLTSKIETLLSDGLSQYQAGTCDTIVIAGMGGMLIREILKAGRHKILPGDHLVLSPHREAEELRRYLFSEGFVLEEEDFILEKNKPYPMMRVRCEGKGFGENTYDPVELRFGPKLLSGVGSNPADYQLYLQNEAQRVRKILGKLPADGARAKELTEEFDLIQQAIERGNYEGRRDY